MNAKTYQENRIILNNLEQCLHGFSFLPKYDLVEWFVQTASIENLMCKQRMEVREKSTVFSFHIQSHDFEFRQLELRLEYPNLNELMDDKKNIRPLRAHLIFEEKGSWSEYLEYEMQYFHHGVCYVKMIDDPNRKDRTCCSFDYEVACYVNESLLCSKKIHEFSGQKVVIGRKVAEYEYNKFGLLTRPIYYERNYQTLPDRKMSYGKQADFDLTSNQFQKKYKGAGTIARRLARTPDEKEI